MSENSVGPVEQVSMNSEVLCIIREAEDLEEITLACYDTHIGDASEEDEVEAASLPSDPFDEAEDSDIEAAWGMDFCVAQVRNAAEAVAEEARRLEFEVERYVEQFLTGASGESSESRSAQEENAAKGNADDMVLEAREIVKEVGQLQKLVLDLSARIEERAEEGNSDND